MGHTLYSYTQRVHCIWDTHCTLILKESTVYGTYAVRGRCRGSRVKDVVGVEEVVDVGVVGVGVVVVGAEEIVGVGEVEEKVMKRECVCVPLAS
jgi:hypothetical protein